MEDWALLDQYVKDGSERAFQELVSRHMSMVYFSAMRRAGSAHAEDVTQAVFIILARKAPGLCRRKATNLAGWLFKTARFAASEALRGEKRRQERERTAQETGCITMPTQNESAIWEQVGPLLDLALDSLAAKDRDAVLLRCVQGASFADVGQAIGVSENTATKRVSRALDKLRSFFSRKGVTLSLPVLSVVLSKSAEAAPAGLAASCSSLALSAASGSCGVTGVTLIAQGAMKAMFLEQLKIAAIVVCAALVFGAATAVTGRKMVDRDAARPSFRLEKLEPLALRYKARSTLPDGSVQFQLNTPADAKTYFAKLGEEVIGFRLVGHEIKTEEEAVQGFTKPDKVDVDVSELILERDNKRIILTKDRYVQCAEYVAYLASRDGLERMVRNGDVFDDQNVKYEVRAICPERNSVTVRRLDNGEEKILRTP